MGSEVAKGIVFNNFEDMDLLSNDIQNVLLAGILGAALGLERQWQGKSAGLRTIMLVSVGSALFTIISFQMATIDGNHGDVTRIASNIVTGIGFLGAGIIFRGNVTVHGLTTAATVWTSSAIGMAAGMGNYLLAIETTVISLFILMLLHWFDLWFKRVNETRTYHISYDYLSGSDVLHYQDFFKERGFKLVDDKLTFKDGKAHVSWKVRATKKHHDEKVRYMLQDARILTLTY
jgi:putative Mg2+ transporter-C (MgtC) family protein